MAQDEANDSKTDVPTEGVQGSQPTKDPRWWRDEETLAALQRQLGPLKDAMTILASAATVVREVLQICGFCTSAVFRELEAKMPAASALTNEPEARSLAIDRASGVLQRAAEIVAITRGVVDELGEAANGQVFSEDEQRILGENLARVLLEDDLAHEGAAQATVRALELSKRPVTAMSRPRARA